MRLARLVAGVALVSALAQIGSGDTRSQDREKDKAGPDKKAAAGPLPRYWDQLALTDAQRAEVLKLTAEYTEKTDKLLEEIRKLDEELARKRVAVPTEDQRQKLLDVASGHDPKGKAKAEPRGKGPDR